MSLSSETQADVIEAFKSTFTYLDEYLNIDKSRKENPQKLKLN